MSILSISSIYRTWMEWMSISSVPMAELAATHLVPRHVRVNSVIQSTGYEVSKRLLCRMILTDPLVLVTKLKIPAGNSKSHLAWKKKFPEMKPWHAQMGQNMQLEASNGFAKCFSIIILPNNSTTHLYGDYAHDFTRQEMMKLL